MRWSQVSHAIRSRFFLFDSATNPLLLPARDFITERLMPLTFPAMASPSCPSSKRAACRDYCSFMALLGQNDGATRFSPVDRTTAFRPFPRHACPSIRRQYPRVTRSHGSLGEVILAMIESQWPRCQQNMPEEGIVVRSSSISVWEEEERERAGLPGPGELSRVRAEKGTNIADKTPSWAAINCWRGGTITAAPATESPCEQGIRWVAQRSSLPLPPLLLLLLLRRRRS
ncbi:hypothetical protein DBV15_08127 [Temnothorax longispinosus]|uniref:Uncharacterized protein n=1 Tax=Temnothorax longispinosus TaxID=300112 RepID=A0A4S2KHA1_9HYME|nr:hypothetical protein DBV15_08127 [Temnothorax longispinosus]